MIPQEKTVLGQLTYCICSWVPNDNIHLGAQFLCVLKSRTTRLWPQLNIIGFNITAVSGLAGRVIGLSLSLPRVRALSENISPACS